MFYTQICHLFFSNLTKCLENLNGLLLQICICFLTLKCHSFKGFLIALDCWIYLYVCLMRIIIRKYGHLSANVSPTHHEISYYLIPKLRSQSSFNIWSSWRLKSILNKIITLPVILFLYIQYSSIFAWYTCLCCVITLRLHTYKTNSMA